MTNNLEHWGVPNHIGVIKEDPGPCNVFDFMGDIGTPYQQTRLMPGKEIRNIEDWNAQDLYMDAYQDYGSMKRKIVHKACQEMECIHEQAQGVQILSKHKSEHTS